MRRLTILVLSAVLLSLTGCTAYYNAQAELARAQTARAQAEQSAAWSTARAAEATENGLTERANIRASERAEARRDFYALILSFSHGDTGGGAAGTDHNGGISAAVGVGIGWPVLAIAVVALWSLVFWLRRHDRGG